MPFMRWTGELNSIKVNGTYTKALDAALTRIVRDGAREAIRAMITRIPVWRGFALGSIKFAKGTEGDLARALRIYTEILITPESKYPKNYKHSDGTVVPKTPENGGLFASYSFSNAQHRYRFSFRDDVVHFLLLNFYSMPNSPSSPWQAIELAHEVFERYVAEHVADVPKIKNFLVKDLAHSIRFK